MRKPTLISRLCLPACLLLLSACSKPIPDLVTVREAPRVEKPELDPAMRLPCERYAKGAPDPSREAVTLDMVTAQLTIVAGRLERCADRNEALNEAWDAIGGVRP